MTIDWSRVLKNRIGKACRRYDVRENCPKHLAITAFLIRNGELYLAKFIRGLAYEVATCTVCLIASGKGEVRR